FPQLFEQLFFELAVSRAALLKPLPHILQFSVGRKQLVKLKYRRTLRILRRFYWLGVRNDAHHSFADLFFVAKKIDGVAVALAHLLAVQSWNRFCLRSDRGFR